MRLRNKIKPEVAEEQGGLGEGKGTTNTIYTTKIVEDRGERSKSDQKYVLGTDRSNAS